MERSGQERAIGMPNSVSYNPPQLNQESPVKLPLAPIISTPPDRRGNATVSTRRGSAIFSPTQTLDQHHLNSPPPLPLPLPQPSLVQKDSTPDPDLATTAGEATGGASNSKIDPPSQAQPHDPPATSTATADSIKYRECLKNHAASIGGHVLDGCGEFMPCGDEGTPEALRCAACHCHRSFHRREADGEPETSTSHYYTYNPNSSNNTSHRNLVLPWRQQQQQQHFTATPPNGPTLPTMVAVGRNSGGAGAESSSDDLNMFRCNARGHEVVQPSFSGSKKRFRTKFSQVQKDRMLEFATRLEWKIQKQDEEELQQFCNEMGVKRQVFKVWMHNNKQAMKKRQM